MQDDDLIAKELNKFFKNAMSTLNIKENRFITNRSSDGITNPIDKAIKKYKFHPRTFKEDDFIFSFCIGLVTQLNGQALGVLKHHYITKRICELLIGN